MSDIVVLKNKILEGAIEVYAAHPETYKMLEGRIKELPQNAIFYPNEYCPVGELQQADLHDLNLKNFLFEEVLPKSGFIKGENPDPSRVL